MPSLPAEQIERIISCAEDAPTSHRHLTLERQLKVLRKRLTDMLALIPEWETVEIDQPKREKDGTVKTGPDGYPVIDRVKASKRSVVAKPFLEQLAPIEAQYRARLAKSNDEHAEDAAELKRAIEREFGEKPQDHFGHSKEIAEFAADFRARKGWAA